MDFLPAPLNLSMIIKLSSSIVALVMILAARAVLSRTLRYRVESTDLRRRWLTSIRTALFIFFALALISIWAETIQTFTVSIIAIAVALVIVTKELSMCLLGSIVRVTGDSYAVGDRVQIGHHRGDVVHHNLLTTILLELGSGTASQQHTGRTITLPNSMLLTNPVTKESSDTPYSLHVFVIPVRRDGDLNRHLETLRDVAGTTCAPFMEDVRRHWKRLATVHDVTGSSPEPRVTLVLTPSNYVDLTIQIPSPIGQQSTLEEAIIQRFLATYRHRAEEFEIDRREA